MGSGTLTLILREVSLFLDSSVLDLGYWASGSYGKGNKTAKEDTSLGSFPKELQEHLEQVLGKNRAHRQTKNHENQEPELSVVVFLIVAPAGALQGHEAMFADSAV